MTRSSGDFHRLIAELALDARDLESVGAENERAAARIDRGADDPLDWAALGYTIHNVYGVMENYCLRVAKFFENSVGRDRWHTELLRRMTLTIETVRPALLDERTYMLVDELRSFRHLFRNLYARPLDPVRTRLVQTKVKPAVTTFLGAHEVFVKKLEAIGRAIDED